MQMLVVADAGRARFYELDDEMSDLVEVIDLIHPEARMKAAEMVEGEAGRLVPHTDRKDVEDERFAREVASELEKRVNGFESLHLAAPPRFLGQIRKVLHGNVEKKMRSSLAKDLTKVPVHDLKKKLLV